MSMAAAKRANDGCGRSATEEWKKKRRFDVKTSRRVSAAKAGGHSNHDAAVPDRMTWRWLAPATGHGCTLHWGLTTRWVGLQVLMWFRDAAAPEQRRLVYWHMEPWSRRGGGQEGCRLSSCMCMSE